jgi:DNA repair exonuclease SbcCD nuclease subunit
MVNFRYNGAEAFLDGRLSALRAESADALVAAGDVFDNTTPIRRAQEPYYRFLRRNSAGELDEMDVFSRCLEKRPVPDADRPELWAAYREILASIQEGDPEARSGRRA